MDQDNTKRGVASLYVVIFATILFGVVTLSFMRIILSEAGQSSDDDLSRSAYDSAMAGVEDAKTAINRCLSGSGGSYCNELFSKDCQNGIGIAKVLYGNYGSEEDGWEVKIQENSADQDPNNNSDQAYTCVVVSDEVADYRSTLTSDTRTKMVPLAVYKDGSANSKLSGVDRISFDWYSLLNQGDTKGFDNVANGKELKGSATLPPTITLTLIKMSSGVSSADFQSANDTNLLTYDTIVLLPSNNGSNQANLARSGNVNKTENNEPIPIKCNSDNSEFACHVDITGLPPMQPSDSLFLVVSLPYGDTVTDFAAAMHAGRDIVLLKGAQISVDSTGRTNQLVRRVETRLDPADLYFPYPQYELELTGTGENDGVNKDFWITANCWKSSGGAVSPCDNNGKISR